MPLNIAASNLIGDSLIAERIQQPVEKFRRIALCQSVMDTRPLNICPDIIEECQRAGEAANFSD